MQGIERRGTRARLVAFPVLVALVLVLVWALLPDIGLGVLLLLGVSAEALVYVGFYLVERRRHW
jgi:uncharacterized RDD family membrane protein YckC